MNRYAYTQEARRRRFSELQATAGALPRREIAKRLGITPNALSAWCRVHKISMALRFENLSDDYKRQKAGRM